MTRKDFITYGYRLGLIGGGNALALSLLLLVSMSYKLPISEGLDFIIWGIRLVVTIWGFIGLVRLKNQTDKLALAYLFLSVDLLFGRYIGLLADIIALLGGFICYRLSKKEG